MMGADAHYEIDRIGVFRPKMIEAAELGPGEIGFITAQIKQVADTRVGDTITDEQAPDRRGAARLQAGAAGGVLRPVSGRRRRFRGSARRGGPPAPQRRQLHLRDGDLRGARLRLPLRLPRAAASGDHPGAAGARVQPRPDRHRALRHLPHRADRRRRRSSCTIPPTCPTSSRSTDHRGAVDQGDDPDARRLSRRGAQALPGPARRRRSSSTMSASAPWWSTTCRSTRWCSISTTG